MISYDFLWFREICPASCSWCTQLGSAKPRFTSSRVFLRTGRKRCRSGLPGLPLLCSIAAIARTSTVSSNSQNCLMNIYIYILYIYHYYLTDFSQNGSDMQWWDNMRCNIYVKRCNQDVIRIFSSSLSTWDFSPYISLWHARPKFNHIQPIGFFVALRIEISDDFRLAAQCSPTNTLLSCPILWIG
jgi:hypothetical protein